jgi:hypothetical protein
VLGIHIKIRQTTLVDDKHVVMLGHQVWFEQKSRELEACNDAAELQSRANALLKA